MSKYILILKAKKINIKQYKGPVKAHVVNAERNIYIWKHHSQQSYNEVIRETLIKVWTDVFQNRQDQPLVFQNRQDQPLRQSRKNRIH